MGISHWLRACRSMALGMPNRLFLDPLFMPASTGALMPKPTSALAISNLLDLAAVVIAAILQMTYSNC